MLRYVVLGYVMLYVILKDRNQGVPAASAPACRRYAANMISHQILYSSPSNTPLKHPLTIPALSYFRLLPLPLLLLPIHTSPIHTLTLVLKNSCLSTVVFSPMLNIWTTRLY